MSILKLAQRLTLQNWSRTLLSRAKRYQDRAYKQLESDPNDVINQRTANTARQWRQEAEIIDDWTNGRDGRPGPDGPVW